MSEKPHTMDDKRAALYLAADARKQELKDDANTTIRYYSKLIELIRILEPLPLNERWDMLDDLVSMMPPKSLVDSVE